MKASPLTRLFAMATVLAAAVASAPAALAQTDGAPVSREQVKQETRAANMAGQIRTGELNAPVAPMVSTKTRAERKAETLAASRNGELASTGAREYREYNVAPRDALAHSTKTRAERKAETMDAIKNKQIMPAGEAA
jgi:hypothetical protein